MSDRAETEKMNEESEMIPDKNGSFQETDSFDEPKGVPISLEPVFSTAGKNIRIDVKQESMNKSKLMLNNDLKPSSSSNSFSSPLLRAKNNGSKAFVSPFRRDDANIPSTSTKRTAIDDGDDNGAPPAKKPLPAPEEKPKNEEEKKSPSKKEMKKFHAVVLRSSPIYEKKQWRMVLQESEKSPLIIGTCSYHRGCQVKFGDRIHVDSEVLKKNDSNEIIKVYIELIIKIESNGSRSDITKHSISDKPFAIPPRFIHELAEKGVKRAVLQVYILDLNMEIYDGCSSCRNFKKPSKSSRRSDCKKCEEATKAKKALFSRIRVMDFSGQMFVNASTQAMQKLMEMFGYEGIDQWFQFKEPQERSNYVFRPIMIEIEHLQNEWECIDVCSVNWKDYGQHLKEKEKEMIEEEMKAAAK